MNYTFFKLLHILSSTVLFGTGIGTAYFMLQAYRSQDVRAIAVVSRHVVMADYIFTTPAVIIQPLTGLFLMHFLHLHFTTRWISLALFLYVLIGACWLPVVWLQVKMSEMAKHAAANQCDLPERFHRYFKRWFLLGWPAFVSVIIIFYLMIYKSPQ